MADDEEKGGSLTVGDALKLYDGHKSYWSDNYAEANIDLKMAAGDRGAHWGEGWDSKYKMPTGAAVVVNELPQYIHQVTNDIRQNVPSIKVLPVSDGDIETGEIFTGLFRAIEDHSHADEVCDTAAEYAVTCSIGFMRLDHDYCDDKSDEQEIVFKTVPDPLSCWLDPASVEYDGRDANSAILLEPINKKDFERLYKGKAFSSFTDPKEDASKKDTINIAEIFIREVSGERGKSYTVRRYKVSGEDILAQTTFPGKYIPIVPVYGEVKWIEGKRILLSLIRQARDPQRRLNHWASKESQILSMAPIAPVVAVQGQLVNDRGQWQSPGTEMVLEHTGKDLDGNPVAAPTRLAPPPIPTGIINAMEGAKENIKESMGIYNAGLGKREGDASGIALQQLDKSGDIATFHYPDNVRRSYGHMGEIAVEMMPVIYDTPRIVQTLSDEQDVQMVGINGAPMQDGQDQHYDLTKGKYRVRITTGASYTTKRQQESAFLQEAFKADPALMQIGGDILFKSMDTPGAQAMAARMKKALPPQFQDDSKDPQVIAMQQQLQQAQQIIQQGAQQMQQLQQQLESKSAKDQSDGVKAEADLIKANAELLKAKTEAAQFVHGGTPQDLPQSNPIEDTPEVLHAKLQGKLAERDQATQQQQMQAESEAADKMRAQQMEEAEIALKQQDLQLKQQQGDALIQVLASISQGVQRLEQQVSRTPVIMRDNNGMISGVTYTNPTIQ